MRHPMSTEHHISFIYVETDNGGIRVDLKDQPVAEVCIGDNELIAVYEYCNLHGLWKKDFAIEKCHKKEKGSYTSPFYPCGAK